MNESVGLLQPYLAPLFPWLYADSRWWTVFGLAGNAIFASRFAIQWLYSEKKKILVVPPIFWHLSFWGSVLSLVYALHLDKLPLLVSFGFLPFLYARNLVLLRRGRSAPAGT